VESKLKADSKILWPLDDTLDFNGVFPLTLTLPRGEGESFAVSLENL
jgi:hypothetical protein